VAPAETAALPPVPVKIWSTMVPDTRTGFTETVYVPGGRFVTVALAVTWPLYPPGPVTRTFALIEVGRPVMVIARAPLIGA